MGWGTNHQLGSTSLLSPVGCLAFAETRRGRPCFFLNGKMGFLQQSRVQMLPGTRSQTDQYLLYMKKYFKSFQIYIYIITRNIYVYMRQDTCCFSKQKRSPFFRPSLRDHWNFTMFLRCIPEATPLTWSATVSGWVGNVSGWTFMARCLLEKVCSDYVWSQIYRNSEYIKWRFNWWSWLFVVYKNNVGCELNFDGAEK